MRFDRLLMVAAFCLVPAGAAAQRPTASDWTREVTAIPVQDRDGRPLGSPWLGGFNLPRPQLVDLDGDGVLDLVIQEQKDHLIHFRQENGRFVWQTDALGGITAGEWFRFVDLDGDGLVDLLTEQPIGYIRAWKNTGTPQLPNFVSVVDSLHDAHGNPIFADPQNILNVVDIDCNGRLDLFLGRVAGHIDRYEEVGRNQQGMPLFELLEERWEGIEILGPVPGDTAAFGGRPTMHGANTMSFGDIDDDGDLDLFWGDFFEAGLLLIRNEGSCAYPDLSHGHFRFPDPVPVITSGYNAPATGDIDGNGTTDVVMGVIGGAYQPNHTSVDNLYLISQAEPDSFEVITRRLIEMIDIGSESIPALADLDGDGDLDLLIGGRISPEDPTTGDLTWFENIGSPTDPVFRERGVLPISGTYHYAPAVVDLDGDGLLDLVLGTWTDQVQWWRNAGTRQQPEWVLADSALVTLTRGSNTTPTLADLDGDGDLDMIVGEASGQLNFYRNDGTPQQPRFALVSDEFAWIDVGRRSVPLLADIDGDGKVELLVGGEDGQLTVWWFNSDGEPVDPVKLMISDRNAAPAVGDLFGRGVADMVVGGIGGGVRLYRGSATK